MSEVFVKIDKNTIKRTVTYDEYIDIRDIQKTHDAFRTALEQDNIEAQRIESLREELDKTVIDESLKKEIIEKQIFSGTGITQSMYDEVKEKLDFFKSLPIETIVDNII